MVHILDHNTEAYVQCTVVDLYHIYTCIIHIYTTYIKMYRIPDMLVTQHTCMHTHALIQIKLCNTQVLT